jgi:DNA invertase Pin-like site-specific DNA recombinase
MPIRYRSDETASINALKLINSGVTSVAEIAKQTGLSDSQVRYRFKHDIAKKKELLKSVGNAAPLEAKANPSKENDSS